jgi:hypothetical protein
MFLSKTLRRAVISGTAFVFSITLAALSVSLLLLATTSCKKKAAASDSTVIDDQRLNSMKIDQTFQGASMEVLKNVQEVETKARYRNWDEALTALEKLAGDSSLSDVQKKTVAQITDWVKQKQAAPAPTQ